MYQRNRRSLILPWLLLTLASPLLQADWEPLPRDLIDLDVVTDRGNELAQYPLNQGGRHYRAYLAARPGAEYRLQIRNRSDARIGLVITVDGRNIIDGKRSELGPDEPMYVLAPHQLGRYDGWRTARDRVNRFYFTDADDSYAGAWGDYSAMGVIAVAVFREREADGPQYLGPQKSHSGDAGTGFGDQAWSPTRRVAFAAQRQASAKYFLKYEWPRTLCQLGVSDDCRQRRNRFWPGDRGFASYPPGYVRR